MPTIVNEDATFPASMLAGNPDLFKRAIAMRVLWLLLPISISKSLPKWLFKPIIHYYIIITPEDHFVDGVVLPPGFLLPDYIVPPEHFVDGVSLPPGSIINYYFSPTSPPTGSDTKNRKTLWFDPPKPLTFDTPGFQLPEGTQIRPLTDFQGQSIFSDPEQLGNVPIEAQFGGIINNMPPRYDTPIYFEPPPGGDTPQNQITPHDYRKTDFFRDLFDQMIDEWFFNDYRRPGMDSPASGLTTSDFWATASPRYDGNIVDESWADARAILDASYINNTTEPVTFGQTGKGVIEGYHIYRSILRFDLSTLSSANTIIAGVIILQITGATAGLVAQIANTTDLTDVLAFSSMTGDATEAAEKDDDDVITLTLTTDMISYLNAHVGELVYFMLRNANFDYANVAPGNGVTGATLGHGVNAADPTNYPTLLLVHT